MSGVHQTQLGSLQEQVLPRRSVVFVNNQVYFRCQESNWSEEPTADFATHWVDPDDSNVSRLPAKEEGFLSSFWACQKLTEEYSSRQLRYDGDALRAFSGILRPLAAGMLTPLVEGLPGYFLDMSLLFIASQGNLQRRGEFASFSWAGWSGQILWPRENYVCFENGMQVSDTTNLVKWLQRMTFIDWAVWQSSGVVEHLSPAKRLDEPSALELLLGEYDNVFPKAAVAGLNGSRRSLTYAADSYSLHRAPWEALGHPPPAVSLHSLDLCNCQAEFDALTLNIKDLRERRMLTNWIASRKASTDYPLPTDLMSLPAIVTEI